MNEKTYLLIKFNKSGEFEDATDYGNLFLLVKELYEESYGKEYKSEKGFYNKVRKKIKKHGFYKESNIKILFTHKKRSEIKR